LNDDFDELHEVAGIDSSDELDEPVDDSDVSGNLK
jgi:hypothetical protein